MAAPYILALDVAGRTGVCEGRVGSTPIFYTEAFASDGDDHEEVFAKSLRWIAERLQFDRPDWIFIEAPLNPGAAHGQTNSTTLVRLNGLWAVLSAAAKVKGVSYRRISVQAARKAFLGEGNLKGHEAKRRAFAMCQELGWSPKNRDESDAGCVWYAAAIKVSPRLAQLVTPMMQQRVAAMLDAEPAIAVASWRQPGRQRSKRGSA